VVSARMPGEVGGRRGEHSHAMRGEVSRLGSRPVAFAWRSWRNQAHSISIRTQSGAIRPQSGNHLKELAHCLLIDGGDGRATGGESDGEALFRALALHGAHEDAPSREPWRRHLMREAIRRSPRYAQWRNQTQSGAIKRNQTQSNAIIRNLRALFTPRYA